MSAEYNEYLTNHIMDVNRAYSWLRRNLPDVANDEGFTTLLSIGSHDDSKYDYEEYEAYDEYFYGIKTKEVKDAFNYAWLHHIHNNPHHWQYWVLINDDPKDGTIALDIPYKYVIEMICDWWSFSWREGNLYEIFDWYEDHKNHMILSDNTRELVEEILSQIKEKLDEEPDIFNADKNKIEEETNNE